MKLIGKSFRLKCDGSVYMVVESKVEKGVGYLSVQSLDRIRENWIVKRNTLLAWIGNEQAEIIYENRLRKQEDW